MSRVVHQRGRGQIAPLCEGGTAPLGWLRAGAEVTCPACAWKPMREAWNTTIAVFQTVINQYATAFSVLADALGVSDEEEDQ